MSIIESYSIEKNGSKFSHVLTVRAEVADPPQWAKSEGEAVLLQFSGFTKDPMHDFKRLFG